MMTVLAKFCVLLLVTLTVCLIRNIIVGDWTWALIDVLAIAINLNTIRMCKEKSDEM